MVLELLDAILEMFIFDLVKIFYYTALSNLSPKYVSGIFSVFTITVYSFLFSKRKPFEDFE